ncbi:condensation domain-containing protein [Nocardia tenerifensis]|uniref:Condensation domain-containing protein n=1 Tax=Nocardia tenerifensis TaxID=228006 RepID=A0A318JZV7_9NOCA|nr:condensation domain-containing protein [Nocardia tenerifensis]
MVSFGFIEEWVPAPGRLTSWTASPRSLEAVRRAPAHPTPPSHQQEQYLRSLHRDAAAGFGGSRLCMISFTIPGSPDHAAWSRAFTAFLRRHDTFLSWFAVGDDGSVVRHVAAPTDIDLVPEEHGDMADSAAIRAHVEMVTPSALWWDCWSFGVIEHENSFTVYAGVDHLHTDGVAQALSCVDLLMLYGNELSGGKLAPQPVDGHLAYCERERRGTAEMTAQSPNIRTWLELLRRNGGDVPSFPADLGVGTQRYIRGAQRTVHLVDEADALRFEEICTANGARFTGGLFAAAALVESEMSGGDWYFGLTPVNTRATAGETNSVGWYTSLIPVEFSVERADSFATIVSRAQQAYDRGKDLTDVSLYRALELAPPEFGIHTQPGWTARMLSYVDVRKIPGVEMFDQINGGMFASRGMSREVYIWVNRFTDITQLSLLFPDTPQAHAAVDRYIAATRTVFAAVAADGDYAPRVGALS